MHRSYSYIIAIVALINFAYTVPAEHRITGNVSPTVRVTVKELAKIDAQKMSEAKKMAANKFLLALTAADKNAVSNATLATACQKVALSCSTSASAPATPIGTPPVGASKPNSVHASPASSSKSIHSSSAGQSPSFTSTPQKSPRLYFIPRVFDL